MLGTESDRRCGRESAKELWKKIPEKVREYGLFHTDDWDSYKTVIPEDKHLYCKQKKYTNHIRHYSDKLFIMMRA
jgi:insertion element IS1 protein InsB